MPEPALDLDGLMMGGLSVQPLERVDVALVGGTLGAEMLFDTCAVKGYVFERDQGVVAQPLVEGKPAVGVLQGEAVGGGCLHSARAVPAQ